MTIRARNSKLAKILGMTPCCSAPACLAHRRALSRAVATARLPTTDPKDRDGERLPAGTQPANRRTDRLWTWRVAFPQQPRSDGCPCPCCSVAVVVLTDTKGAPTARSWRVTGYSTSLRRGQLENRRAIRKDRDERRCQICALNRIGAETASMTMLLLSGLGSGAQCRFNDREQPRG